MPGFFPKKAEIFALERVLEGELLLTILCGATSVGKVCPLFFEPHYLYSKTYTQFSLLREALLREECHILRFNLRIAGFADLASLYQMEQYFEEISTKMEGFEGFKKEAWSFKVRPHRLKNILKF